MAQVFDPGKLRLEGEPLPVLENVSDYSVSRNGVLVWQGPFVEAVQLAAYSREGRRLETFGQPRRIREMALSPDGRRAVVEIWESGLHIWSVDLASSIFSPVINTPTVDVGAVCSPDGREIVFSSNRKGQYDLYRKVIGGAPEELLLESPYSKFPDQWLADGSILYQGIAGRGLFRLPSRGSKKPETLFQSEFDNEAFAVSEDGHWITYSSDESGRWEVYLAAYPGFTGRHQISNSGGCQGMWRKDGKELFYLTLEGQIMAVDIRPGAAAEAGIPRELFRVPMRVDPILLYQYAVTADGKKFFVLESAGDDASTLNVMLNWNAHLKR